MTTNAISVVVVASLFLMPATTMAQQSTTKTITRQDSKLVLDMPGLNGGREIFEFYGWNPSYTTEKSYAAQVKWNANYPRAQVYLTVLRPGYIWTRENIVDEAVIKGSVPFLKDRTITIETADQGGQSRTLPHVRTRFSVDGAKCIWFKSLGGGGDGCRCDGCLQRQQL